MIYNPLNWYWIVAGNTTQVWSSASMSYVDLTDATYTAWVAAGNIATNIANAAELAAVLLDQWQPLYTAQGCAVTSTATPALNGTYSLSQTAQAYITGLSSGIAASKPLPGGGTTFNYFDIAGVNHSFASSDFLNFASAIENLIYEIQNAVMAAVGGTPTAIPALSVTIA